MKDRTREKILSVASRLFGKYGFHKTTVDEIARAAHKAKGSVYYYFKSKEELFLAVVTQEIQVLKSGLTKVIVENQADATGLIKSYILKRMYLMKDGKSLMERTVTVTYEVQHAGPDNPNMGDAPKIVTNLDDAITSQGGCHDEKNNNLFSDICCNIYIKRNSL